MGQPVKKEINNSNKIIKKKTGIKKKKTHKEYGTSKLEEKFAKDFLDVLNIKYDYQFKAESIGRYYDFLLHGFNYGHSDPRLYEGKELNPTQKRNKKVDFLKKKWADEHKIPIYYFWEKDINETPKKVLQELKEIVIKETNISKLKNNKKKRH